MSLCRVPDRRTLLLGIPFLLIMRSRLSKNVVAALASSRRLNDAGLLPLITWCGALALLGYSHVGGSRRRRLAVIAFGVALLILGHGFSTQRRSA